MTHFRVVALNEKIDHLSAFSASWKEDLAVFFALVIIGVVFALATLHAENRTERLEAACVASGGHSIAGRLDYVECGP